MKHFIILVLMIAFGLISTPAAGQQLNLQTRLVTEAGLGFVNFTNPIGSPKYMGTSSGIVLGGVYEVTGVSFGRNRLQSRNNRNAADPVATPYGGLRIAMPFKTDQKPAAELVSGLRVVPARNSLSGLGIGLSCRYFLNGITVDSMSVAPEVDFIDLRRLNLGLSLDYRVGRFTLQTQITRPLGTLPANQKGGWAFGMGLIVRLNTGEFQQSIDLRNLR